MCGFVIRKTEMLVMPLLGGGITNPTLLSVEPFLTVDYKSTGTVRNSDCTSLNMTVIRNKS